MLYRNSDLWRLFAPDMSAKPNEVRELKDLRVKTMQKMANSHKENSNNASGTICKNLDAPHHLGRIDSRAKCCTKILKECYPHYLTILNSREINECNKFLKSIKK